MESPMEIYRRIQSTNVTNMNLRDRFDAISASFNYHQEFLQILKRQASEYISKYGADDSDEDENDAANGNENWKGLWKRKWFERRQDDTETFTSPVTENSNDNSANLSFEENTNTIVSEATMTYIQNLQHNADTMFQMEFGRLELAMNINKTVLSRTPDNFNALWNRAALLLTSSIDESNNSINKEIEEILGRLENDITRNDKLMQMAKAEIAGMYPPAWLEKDVDLLLKCTALYEECIENSKSDDVTQPGIIDLNLIQYWKRRLVEIYSWLSYGHIYDRVVEIATRYVQDIDEDQSIENKLKAKSWVNLAVIIQHGQPRYERTYTYSSDNQPSSLYCFEKALEMDPTNPRIHLQIGRELRRRPGSTAEDLQLAISYFRRALDNPSNPDTHREYILHHMGLTYKSLWILEDRPQHDRRAEERFYSFRYLFEDNEDEDRPSFGCKVIKPPCEPFEYDRIPIPYRNVSKGATYRFFSPTARDPRNEYLLQAKDCFQRAIDICFEHCLYLIDLSRLHISSGNVQEAGNCLMKAQAHEYSDLTSASAVGVDLYELIGYYEEINMIETRFDDAKAKRVKDLYREAIRQSTKNKWKPQVAFHHILRILYKQLQMNISRSQLDHMILQDEYFLLYMAIQEVHNDRYIVNSLTSDEVKIGLMWRLIKMFYDRNQEFDAAAGFTYISVLCVFEKFETEISGMEMTLVEKQRILLKLAERVAIDRTQQQKTRFCPEGYKRLCELSLSEETLYVRALSEETGSPSSRALTVHEKLKLDIVNDIVCRPLYVGFIRSTEQC